MFWHVAKEISFKDVSILALVAMLCFSSEMNILVNFGKGHYADLF